MGKNENFGVIHFNPIHCKRLPFSYHSAVTYALSDVCYTPITWERGCIQISSPLAPFHCMSIAIDSSHQLKTLLIPTDVNHGCEVQFSNKFLLQLGKMMKTISAFRISN